MSIQENDHEEGAASGKVETSDARANLLSQVREQREAVRSEHIKYLDIPGYNGLLVAKFRPYPVSKGESKTLAIARSRGDNNPVLLGMSCDNLINACEEILLRNAKGDLIQIDDEAFPPIAFDVRLADHLGFEAKSARQVLVGLFPTEQSIVAMSGEVSQWLQDTTRDADNELLGESLGTES